MKNSENLDKSKILNLLQKNIGNEILKNNESLKKERSRDDNYEDIKTESRKHLEKRITKEVEVESTIASLIDKDIRIAIHENNDKFRTEIEDKIKSVKQEIRDDKILFLNTTKWVIGIISGIIISVISLFYYLYMPDIKLIPVHEDRIKNLKEDINNLEKNFEKFFKNKKF